MASHPCLYDLLYMGPILLEVSSELPCLSLLKLAATSHSFRTLVFSNPILFRTVDLSHRRIAVQDPTRKNRTVSEGQHLNTRHFKAVFNLLRQQPKKPHQTPVPVPSLFRQEVLSAVQILVLDGQMTRVQDLGKLILDPSFPLRILSICDTRFIHMQPLHARLQRYREQRPDGPLAGIYVFGTALTGQGKPRIAADDGAPDARPYESPWHRPGAPLPLKLPSDWRLLFELPFHYDAVLCRGARHFEPHVDLADLENMRALDVVSLRGCESCHGAPEGLVDVATARPSPALPLLRPIAGAPSVAAAQTPFRPESRAGAFLARCRGCLGERWCEACGRWWCEACFDSWPVGPDWAPLAPVLVKVRSAPLSLGWIGFAPRISDGASRDLPMLEFLASICPFCVAFPPADSVVPRSPSANGAPDGAAIARRRRSGPVWAAASSCARGTTGAATWGAIPGATSASAWGAARRAGAASRGSWAGTRAGT